MGKYWQPLIEAKRRALENPDWNNMRSNALTANIDDSNRSWANEASHMRLAQEMWSSSADRIKSLQLWWSMAELDYGNPYRVEISGVKTSRAALDYTRMLATLLELSRLQGREPKVVVEIGGGYGGLACRAMRAWKDCEWWDIDFPEMLQIAEHYMTETAMVDPRRFKTAIVPHAVFFRDADVVINTRSMMEMDFDEVSKYLSCIQDNTRPGTVFYCLNREQKVTKMRDWPWDGRWAVVRKQPWPTNPACIEMVLIRSGGHFT